MGIFDDTEVYVDVVANKLTDNTTSPIKNAVISAVMRDSGISDGILAGMINGLAARAHRFYNYANDGNHPDGLPTAELGIEGNGTYESVYEAFPGTFYPIVNIRKDGEFLTEISDPPKHAATKKLLKRVALNLDNIVANISDTDREDENGDPIVGNPVEDLDDIFFLFGIDIFSTEAQSAVYMYDFFEHIKDDVPIDAQLHQFYKDSHDEDGDVGEPQGVPSNGIKLTEAAGDYEIKILFDYMFHATFSGQLTHPLTGKNVKGYITSVPGGIEPFAFNDAGGTPYAYTYVDTSYVIFWKQNDDDTYSAWTVYGLQHVTNVLAYAERNRVVRSLIEIPESDGATGIYWDYHDLVAGDPEWGRSGFYFPLCKEVLELQHTIQEEKVLVDAMTLIFHAAQEVDLAWYQQGWFKIIMVIVVALVVWFSLGQLFKEAMTFLDFAMALITQVGIAYLIELVIKEIDGALGLIIATALAAYAVTRGNLSSTKSLLPYAKEVLQVTHVASQVTKAYTKKQSELLQEDIDELQVKVDNHNDEMQALYNELGKNKYDPMWAIEMEHRYPSKRSVGNYYGLAKTTNVAGIVKESISEYHSRMKMLPRHLNNEEMITG